MFSCVIGLFGPRAGWRQDRAAILAIRPKGQINRLHTKTYKWTPFIHTLFINKLYEFGQFLPKTKLKQPKSSSHFGISVHGKHYKISDQLLIYRYDVCSIGAMHLLEGVTGSNTFSKKAQNWQIIWFQIWIHTKYTSKQYTEIKYKAVFLIIYGIFK